MPIARVLISLLWKKVESTFCTLLSLSLSLSLPLSLSLSLTHTLFKPDKGPSVCSFNLLSIFLRSYQFICYCNPIAIISSYYSVPFCYSIKALNIHSLFIQSCYSVHQVVRPHPLTMRSVYFKVKTWIEAATKKSAKRPKKTWSNFDDTEKDQKAESAKTSNNP